MLGSQNKLNANARRGREKREPSRINRAETEKTCSKRVPSSYSTTTGGTTIHSRIPRRRGERLESGGILAGRRMLKGGFDFPVEGREKSRRLSGEVRPRIGAEARGAGPKSNPALIARREGGSIARTARLFLLVCERRRVRPSLVAAGAAGRGGRVGVEDAAAAGVDRLKAEL